MPAVPLSIGPTAASGGDTSLIHGLSVGDACKAVGSGVGIVTPVPCTPLNGAETDVPPTAFAWLPAMLSDCLRRMPKMPIASTHATAAAIAASKRNVTRPLNVGPTRLAPLL